MSEDMRGRDIRPARSKAFDILRVNKPRLLPVVLSQGEVRSMVGVVLAVLHTWTRTLEWRPHLHMLVPGGGLAADGRTWLSVPRRRKRFFIPVRALAKRFRGRFLHLARRASPDVSLPEIPWGKRWVAFAKPAVQGLDKVLDYLGRYVCRTALSDKAIVGCDEHGVTFTYRPSDGSPHRTMTLPANEFLRRFLQHVLPKGVPSSPRLRPAAPGPPRDLAATPAPARAAGSPPAARVAVARAASAALPALRTACPAPGAAPLAPAVCWPPGPRRARPEPRGACATVTAPADIGATPS